MKKITFKSKDGLLITADHYPIENPKNTILLCHRSHCNRAEYRETAPKLNQMGYDCIAIDQRSGMKIFGETNETKNRAKEQRLPTGYLDAKPDILAAIDYTYILNNNKPILLLGSSYSAALALMIAAENNAKIKAVLVFSPDEHLKQTNLADIIKDINIPIYATSAKKEIEDVINLFRFVHPKHLTHFKPESDGFHGSKILWEVVKGYEKHWDQIDHFLKTKI